MCTSALCRGLFAALILVSIPVAGALAQAPAEHAARKDSIAYVTREKGFDCSDKDWDSISPCRVRKSWSVATLRTRRAKEGRPVWVEGDEITFVYQG